MNNLVSISSLMLAISLVSCVKEEDHISKPYDSRQIVFSIDSPAVKSVLDPGSLSVNWSQNDTIAIWSKGTDCTTKLIAVSGGASSSFVGEIGTLDTSKDLFAVYPASAIKMQTSGYTGCTLLNHSTQTGLLSDFGKYNVSYTTKLTKQVDGDRLRISYDRNPSNIFAIIKFNIKDGLDVRSITIKGYDSEGNNTNIAGNLNFKPSRPGIYAIKTGQEITISRNGDVINGDVYVFISPNSPTAATEGISDAPIISSENPAINTAAKLKFVFTNSSGKICEFTNLLNEHLTAGVLTNLGSITRMVFQEGGLYVVRGGEKWAQLSQKKDIESGSALDFSSIAIDSPAGKYGPLKAVGNHFEFQNSPGITQVLYGANLTTSACAPEKAKSDLVAVRMTRIGYNTIRLHHYDDLWQANENDTNGDTYRDRMDYFISNAKNRGLYLYLDMYSSRKVKYSDLGLDGEGNMTGAEYKFLAVTGAALADDATAVSSGHVAAYSNWCNFVMSVLGHTNTYTGMTYAADPAISIISVVNEPAFSTSWSSVRNLEPVKYAWKKCHGATLANLFPASSQSVGSAMWNTFILWLQTNGYSEMVDYCRDAGYNGLLTVAYDKRCNLDSASGLSDFDFHDSHSYVDHPSGDIPERTIDGENPLSGLPEYVDTGSSQYANVLNQRPGVPHTLSEWNHCTPNPLRGVGALLGSAYMRSRGWDGIWRFAYAQGSSNLFDTTTPNSFDVSKDEVMKASDAGVVSFFLRGDVTNPESQVSYSSSEMSIVTDKSIAIYKESMGLKTAGILSADTSIYPATILVTSMDGSVLSTSSKILLCNITDCAGNAATYTDESKRVTISYGNGQMIRISESGISLAVNSPGDYTVYELNTSGERTAVIPSAVVDGKLCFSISVRGTDGKAHLYYEISK